MAAAVSSSETTAKMIGSRAPMPNRKLESTRVSASAPAIPAASPARESFAPWLRTRREMSLRVAPSAMRRPISEVRWLTDRDTTP